MFDNYFENHNQLINCDAAFKQITSENTFIKTRRYKNSKFVIFRSFKNCRSDNLKTEI